MPPRHCFCVQTIDAVRIDGLNAKNKGMCLFRGGTRGTLPPSRVGFLEASYGKRG